MKPNLRLVSVKVDEIEEMTTFYNQLLQKEPDEVEEGRLVEYRFDGVLFGLYDPTADSTGADKYTRGTNCVPAFKLGQDYEDEKERINEMVDVVYEAEENGHKWFIFEDPEGNRLEMYRGSI